MSITTQQLAAGLRAFANALDGNFAPGAVPPETSAPALVSPPPPPPPPPPPAPSGVTAEQLTELIMPHIGNQAIKEALGVAMRENGVANLPEAQPHQYGTLFTAFQGVLQRFGIGASAPANPAPPASII